MLTVCVLRLQAEALAGQIQYPDKVQGGEAFFVVKDAVDGKQQGTVSLHIYVARAATDCSLDKLHIPVHCRSSPVLVMDTFVQHVHSSCIAH